MGLGRLSAIEPQVPVRHYQRERSGKLIHLDIKKLARFEGVGHRIIGNRRSGSQGMSYDFLHVAIDDATGLAYVEVLPDERRWSTTGFLVRALRWFREHGVQVERVMTDNRSGYVARLFRKALRMLGIRHIRTPPYTPRTNGKAERFIQTLLREWTYAIPFKSSDRRPTSCHNGSPGTIITGLMLTLQSELRLRPSPEQPDQIPQLGGGSARHSQQPYAKQYRAISRLAPHVSFSPPRQPRRTPLGGASHAIMPGHDEPLVIPMTASETRMQNHDLFI